MHGLESKKKDIAQFVKQFKKIKKKNLFSMYPY